MGLRWWCVIQVVDCWLILSRRRNREPSGDKWISEVLPGAVSDV